MSKVIFDWRPSVPPASSQKLQETVLCVSSTKNFPGTPLQNTKVTALRNTKILSKSLAHHPFIEKPSPALKNSSTFERGRLAEISFKNLLISRGYKILNSNWRTPYGEVDV